MNVNPKSINSIRAVSELNAPSEASPAPAEAAGGSASSKVTLSPRSRQLSELSDVVSGSSDVRQELVDRFKSEIAAGTYQVDFQQLAGNMVKEG